MATPMGKKSKKKKGKKRHHLLTKPDTYAIGKTLTIPQLYADHYKRHEEKHCNARSTCNSNSRYVRRWSQWWSGCSSDPLTIDLIDQRCLETFQRWLLDRGKCASDVNAHVQTIRKLLRYAAKRQYIQTPPACDSLQAQNSERKFVFTNPEVCQLWNATNSLAWPFSTAIAPGQWRSAICLWWHYGFRTQELVRLQDGFRPLLWGNVYPAGVTPNEEGRAECEYGWISYVPQKQERHKPDPVVVPLTKYTRAALESIRPEACEPSRPVFDWPKSSQGLYQTWKRLLSASGVKPRLDGHKYKIKHFRKTATTRINEHRPGIAPYIVGHAGNRSAISDRHYNNPEGAVLEAMQTLPVPECFEELL